MSLGKRFPFRNVVLPVSVSPQPGDNQLLYEAATSKSEATPTPGQAEGYQAIPPTSRRASARTPRPRMRAVQRAIYQGGEGLHKILRARDEGQGCCNSTEYWPETLFAIQGRSFPFWPLLVYAVYSASIVVYVIIAVQDYKESKLLQGLNAPLETIGYALFLLLTFRTQSTYDRWWEGRKQFEVISSASRDIGRIAVSYFRDDKELAERLIRWTIAFVQAAKNTLRREQEVDDYADLSDVLTATELTEMLGAPHKPSYVSWRISTYLARYLAQSRHGEAAGDTPTWHAGFHLETALSSMVQACSAAERIKNTPMPFAIVVHLRSFLVLWLAAIPFVFVTSLHWLTIGFCIVVGYALLGFESFGVEIESPFGHDYNDLPLDKIQDGIKANLLSALDFLNAVDDAGATTQAQPAAFSTALTAVRSRRRSVHIDVWGIPTGEVADDSAEERGPGGVPL